MTKVIQQRTADDQRSKKMTQLEAALQMRRELTEADADLHGFLTMQMQGLVRDIEKLATQ